MALGCREYNWRMESGNAKEQLACAAVDAMHRRGYRGCSIENITDAAGVPMGSFYNHFESKETLAIEALNHYWNDMYDNLLTLCDSNFSPPVRLLRYFGRLNAKVREQRYQSGCLVGNLSAEMSEHSDAIRNRLVTLFSTWSDAIEECVRQGQTDGSIRNGLPPESLGRFLLNAWQGSAIRARAERSGAALTDFEQFAAGIISR